MTGSIAGGRKHELKKRVVISTLFLIGALAGGLLPAHASSDLVFVSTAGEQFRGYTMPVVVLQVGSKLSYLNLDAAAHTVTATDIGPDRPWCATFGYAPGTCPLFDSGTVTLGGPAPLAGKATVPVTGIEFAPPGQYTFVCINHPAQKGTLIVV